MADDWTDRERAAAEAMKPMVGQSLEWCLPIARVALRAAEESDKKSQQAIAASLPHCTTRIRYD